MTTVKGSWELQDVRDKALAGIWKEYDASGDPFTLFAWGQNTQGNLGLNNRTNYSSPTQIPGTNWSTFIGDGYVSAATKLDGTLWMWGNNTNGALGTNNKTKYSSPTQIPGTTWSRSVGCNDGNSGCIKSDGTMWMWGKGDEGTPAQNNRTNYSSPRQVGSDTTWSSTRGHAIVGDMHVVAIKTDGTLWAWGYNRVYGQLGQNNRNNTSSPVQIGAGTNWKWVGKSWQGSFAINTSGELYAWGSNYYGCLGYPNAPGDSNSGSRSSPTQVPGTTWKTAYGSSTHTLAVKTDGTLWAFGSNSRGQLGQNQPESSHRSSPVQIPGTTWTEAMGAWGGMVAQKSDGTLWTWGNNQAGRLGHNNEVYYSSPVQVPGTNWVNSSSGNSHMMGTKPA